MNSTLESLKRDVRARHSQADLDRLWDVVGFNAYAKDEKRYK
jgi:hypothetical protein